MLVDNKFLYISLPRCGSTSFHYSCILNGLDIKNYNSEIDIHNNLVDFTNIKESEIMNLIAHEHIPLPLLRKKFGFKYHVIAVKRDRHDTFYSLYKHILFDLKRAKAHKVYDFFKNISLDELFFLGCPFETKGSIFLEMLSLVVGLVSVSLVSVILFLVSTSVVESFWVFEVSV